MSEAELASLKSTLRSLVVSSPTRVDLRSLLRDYRSLIGEQLPLDRFGYRDPLIFLKERCSDCFLFQGVPSNPSLTLIVPETLKHIDKFVQNQKSTPSTKLKGKRTSIPGHVSHILRQENMVVKTYIKKNEEKNIDCKTNTNIEKRTDVNCNVIQARSEARAVNNKERSDKESDLHRRSQRSTSPERRVVAAFDSDRASSSQDNHSSAYTSSSQSSSKQAQLEELKNEIHALIKDSKDGIWCTELVTRFRERYDRVPEFTRFGYTSIVGVVQTLGGRVRVTRVAGRDWLLQDAGAPPLAAAPEPPGARPAPAPPARKPRAAPADEDALPGVPYAPDVFPADCLLFEESVPPADLSELRPGTNLEVIVGEVYSPSHFWLIRLGPDHSIAMEELMDDMTEYFETGEGRDRYLARAALRVGQYCAALYDRDWHRAIIVDLLDGEDLVKVRHVDYGTVDTVAAATLRPLPRRWARLPMQAMRARQAGVRPAAAGRRWPHAASEHFLRLVRDRALVASIVAVDLEEATLEAFLVDTSQEEDEDIARELVRAGYADERRDSALRAKDCYLYPAFWALETGATPNFAEIHRYLQDGITLDYVPAYRRHVPAALPPLAPASSPSSSSSPCPSPSPPSSPSPSPPPPPAPALNRVPLLRPPALEARTSEPALPTSSPPVPATAAPAQRPRQFASSCQFSTAGLSFPPPAMPPPLYGVPPPPPQQGIPPPQQGIPSPPQQSFPPPPQQGFSRPPQKSLPPPPQQGIPPQSQQRFHPPPQQGFPPRPQQGFPPPPQQGFPPRPQQGFPPLPPQGFPLPPQGIPALPAQGLPPPHGVPPHGMIAPPAYGPAGAGATRGEPWQSETEAEWAWAMYEHLTATARLYKMEAMRRRHAPPPPPYPPYASRPPPGF